MPRLEDALLPGVPADLVEGSYGAAPGNELAAQFHSPESSAALVANAFGFFLRRPRDLPAFRGGADWGFPAEKVCLEAILRFPWNGGRHPCLDVLIETPSTLLGIESKRFEPFRGRTKPALSPAYDRPVWGDRMAGYSRILDGLRIGTLGFAFLDAAQLIKHAFALRTEAHPPRPRAGKTGVLVYLFAEPAQWPDGGPTVDQQRQRHREEIARFADIVAGDEIEFFALSYKAMLAGWYLSPDSGVVAHAAAVAARFAP